MQDVPPTPLGNGEPPALAFQAHPGGTGALLEQLWSRHDGPAFAHVVGEVRRLMGLPA